MQMHLFTKFRQYFCRALFWLPGTVLCFWQRYVHSQRRIVMMTWQKHAGGLTSMWTNFPSGENRIFSGWTRIKYRKDTRGTQKETPRGPHLTLGLEFEPNMGGRRRFSTKRGHLQYSTKCHLFQKLFWNWGQLCKYHYFLHVIGATGNLTPIRPEQYNVNHWKRSDSGRAGGEPRSSYREFWHAGSQRNCWKRDH